METAARRAELANYPTNTNWRTEGKVASTLKSTQKSANGTPRKELPVHHHLVIRWNRLALIIQSRKYAESADLKIAMLPSETPPKLIDRPDKQSSEPLLDLSIPCAQSAVIAEVGDSQQEPEPNITTFIISMC